ncbi:uncharacterized protein LOC122037271 isoform X1 [Zingiber officinale]|uniref:uncharacterized protein LOC122037271 isoform X1 n=1 Tax=Zingiber officinale TaxID=94328 RepID=UPI001C4BDCB8|nr:uncharacterized protein LOC122037271 isoform X1 [Zingiber officinale]
MSSRSQFASALGRSRQIDKRARPISDGPQSDDYMPSLCGKPSVRKSRRTEGHYSRFMNKNPRDKQIKSNREVGKDDLRWKLIRKSLSRRKHLVAEGQHDVVLREKLSRNVHASSSSNAKQQPKESSVPSLGRRIPPARSADNLLEFDSHRKTCSVTLDQPRHSSPDRLICIPRHISPSRRYKERQHVSGIRSLDASMPSYPTNDAVGNTSRALTMTKTISVDAARLLVRAPPPGAIVQRSVYSLGEPLTVGDLLKSLGLDKYTILFQSEEVDMLALRQMGDNDLKEMGIPMGPRKKILLAVLSHTKCHQQC